MAKQGKHGITWTNETWNPIRGCSRVSEGCRHCYAERVAARFSGRGEPYEGLAKLVTIDLGKSTEHKEARWTGAVHFVEDHLLDPLRWTRPRMVFVNSMSDVFHRNVKVEWIDKIFAVMALAYKHQFQLLTKRHERMREYMTDPDTRRRVAIAMLDLVKHRGDDGPIALVERPDSTAEQPLFWSVWPLPNVWLGISAEDQEAADERVPSLLHCPAAVRWISYEPALGPLTLHHTWLPSSVWPPVFSKRESGFHDERNGGIHWVVCGGESGPGARPMHPDWARDTRDQCLAAGVAYFFKQWGEWIDPRQSICGHYLGQHGYVSDGREHSYGCANSKVFVMRIGKKRAGDLLDGRQWHEFPLAA